MINIWQRIFIEHPKSVNETYFQHMRVAGWFATRLLAAGGASIIHALIPCLCKKTASRMISEMHMRMTRRN